MPSKIKIQIRAELRDPQGKLIKRYPWKTANSLLKQFIQLLTVQISQAAQTITRTSGADIAIDVNAYNLGAKPDPGVATSGIVVGTGTTPVTMTDHKLETQVTTNISHSVQTFALENPDANTWRLAISRVLTNNTGSTLGIREVALYAWGGPSPYFFCADHTLYSVDVPNGVGVTLTYRITVSL